MKQFKLMTLFAAMFIAGIVGMILMMKYTTALAESGVLGASMMLSGALTIFGAIGFHHERDLWRSQRKRAPFFKSLRDHPSFISLHKYWQTLTWKKRLILALWVLHFPLAFFWGAVVFTDFFITRVEVPSLVHLVTWIIIVFDFVIAFNLYDDETAKHMVKEIRKLCRGKHNATG